MKKPTFGEEQKLWKMGYEYVIGVDEVGRGAFAGPVTAGAVIFKKSSLFKNSVLAKINDSKLLNPKIRTILSGEIKRKALFYSTSTIGVSAINKVGIGKVTQMAMRKVVGSIMYQVESTKRKDRNTKYILQNTKYYTLVDGFHIKYLTGIGLKNQKGIIKGDRKSVSIAAASIIAKVYRDNLMKNLDKKYPGYKFSKNKGYGTKEHREALKKYGLSKIHRQSFNLSKFI